MGARHDPGRYDEKDLATWRDLWQNFRAKHRQLTRATGFSESAEEPRSARFDPGAAEGLRRNLAELDELTTRPSQLERRLSDFDAITRSVEDGLQGYLQATPRSRRAALESATDDFIAAADSILTWGQRHDPGRYDEKDLATWRDLWQNFRAKHRQLTRATGFSESAEEPRSARFDPGAAEGLRRNLAELDELTTRPSQLERRLSDFDAITRSVEDGLQGYLQATPRSRRAALESATDDFIAAADSILTWGQRHDPGRYDEKDLATWRDLWQNFRAKHRQLTRATGFSESAEEPRSARFDPGAAEGLRRNLAELDELTTRPSQLERRLSDFDAITRSVEDGLQGYLQATPRSRRAALESATDDFIAAADSILTWGQRHDPGRYDEKDLATWRDLWQNFRAKHRQLTRATGFSESAEEPRSARFDPGAAEGLRRNLAELDEQ